MNYSASNNTYSFNGAKTAPSCRSAVKSTAIEFTTDTAIAVSVLFCLIIAAALCVISAISIEICRLTMLAIIIIFFIEVKQTVKRMKRD